MHTSYYAKSAENPNAVSIAGKAPVWYHGREYKLLAPKWSFFKKYKDKNDPKYKDEQYYTEQYYNEVLETLDPRKVYEILGEHAVILCYEKSGEFCHRHLVAEWLMDNLGIEITEL